MYSGITRGLFPVVELTRREGVTRFTVELSPELSQQVELGASIGLDGVCLTVVAFEGCRISFEAIAETLGRSTLGQLEVGRKLSVERSVRVGDELGGHDVFGHVIGTGTVVERRNIGGQLDLTLEVPRAWLKYILPKGFVALDGSSLTVGEVDPSGRFNVHLIPETQRLTNFPNKQVGDRINVELDSRTVAIVDTVERVLLERGLVR
ncbi:MAG: riboflavin synthase subunit alpha [Myxococcaceae bacterium]|nr:riboflavin synthase subunit alpha [Myxococcaceae bacterium]